MEKSVFSSIWEAKAEHKRRQAARKRARDAFVQKQVASVDGLPIDVALERLKLSECAHCGNVPEYPKRIHLHHPTGYGQGSEHTVIPLCPSCHRQEHARLDRARGK